MKKILLSVCVAISLISVVIAQDKKVAVTQDKKVEEKLSYREVGSILPPIRMIDTLKHEYSADDFKNKNNFFLIMFNPTCGHCIKMARLMNDNKEVFKKNNVIFLAGPAMLPYMPTFYQASGITNDSPIKVGVDSASTIDRLYLYQTLPQINVYDKNRRLIRIMHGDVSLDTLKHYIP
jgi:hypothetical protein